VTTPVRPSSFAQDEIEQYIRRYDAELPGLGDGLWRDIQAVIELISEYPSIGKVIPRMRGKVRRITLSHFPFFVIYRDRDHYLEIVALAHTSRRPNYWRSRLRNE
jgi:toxin ParE1/3/4